MAIDSRSSEKGEVSRGFRIQKNISLMSLNLIWGDNMNKI